MRKSASAQAVLLVFLLLACGRPPEEKPAPAPAERAVSPVVVRTLSSPAGAASAEPFLSTAPDGSLLMSWFEKRGEKQFALLFARFQGGAWSAPRTIVERSDFFVNWADFPSIIETSDRTLYAHWLQKSSEGVYSYDVRVSHSDDGGATWSPSLVAHRDGKKAEHGFVSLVPAGDGSVHALWLDGRKMVEGEESGPMTLRYARISKDGRIESESELDDLVCECCQTSMASTDSGLVAVYRDRTADEVRDTGIVRMTGSAWSKPGIVHADAWKINACPVNGPQVDARGKNVAVSWFTAAGGRGSVLTAFSHDSGVTFGSPIVVDEGAPTGRVDLVMMEDASAVVSWIEGIGKDAEVRGKRIWSDGKKEKSFRVGATSAARSAGVPRSTRSGKAVYFAWTEAGDPAHVRLASAEFQ